MKVFAVVGIGKSPKEAMEDYTQRLADKGNWSALGSSGKTITENATILRIGQVAKANGVYFYIATREDPNKIFVAGLDLSNELPLTQVNDKVSLTYIEAVGATVNLTGFDNMMLSQTKSAEQNQIETDKQGAVNRNNN